MARPGGGRSGPHLWFLREWVHAGAERLQDSLCLGGETERGDRGVWQGALSCGTVSEHACCGGNSYNTHTPKHWDKKTKQKKTSLAAPTRCSGTFCCTEVNIFCGGDLGWKYLGVKTQHQGCLRAGDGKYVSRSTLHRLSVSP